MPGMRLPLLPNPEIFHTLGQARRRLRLTLEGDPTLGAGRYALCAGRVLLRQSRIAGSFVVGRGSPGVVLIAAGGWVVLQWAGRGKHVRCVRQTANRRTDGFRLAWAEGPYGWCFSNRLNKTVLEPGGPIVELGCSRQHGDEPEPQSQGPKRRSY
jgi:hypothetical protein